MSRKRSTQQSTLKLFAKTGRSAVCKLEPLASASPIFNTNTFCFVYSCMTPMLEGICVGLFVSLSPPRNPLKNTSFVIINLWESTWPYCNMFPNLPVCCFYTVCVIEFSTSVGRCMLKAGSAACTVASYFHHRDLEKGAEGVGVHSCFFWAAGPMVVLMKLTC